MVLRKILAFFGVKFDAGQLDRGTKKVEKTKDSLRKLDKEAGKATNALTTFAGVFAGALGVGAIIDQARAFSEMSLELSNWSSRLNISVEDMSAWSSVARSFGASTDDVTDSLNDLRLRAQDAINEANTQRENFALLGITTDQLAANVGNATDLMDLFTNAVSNHADESLSAFAVDELLSDAGVRMLPVFRAGAARVQEMRESHIENNRATIEAAKRARELAPFIAELRDSFNELRSSIAVRVIPYVRRLMSWFSRSIRVIDELSQRTSVLYAALASLGLVALATIGIWGPTVGVFLAVAAALAAIFLVAEDLIKAFEGGNSAIKNLIASMIGVEATEEIIDNVKQRFDEIKGSIDAVTTSVGGLTGAFEYLSEALAPIVDAFQLLYRFQQAFSPQHLYQQAQRAYGAVAGTDTAQAVAQRPSPVVNAVAGFVPEFIGGGLQGLGTALSQGLNYVEEATRPGPSSRTLDRRRNAHMRSQLPIEEEYPEFFGHGRPQQMSIPAQQRVGEQGGQQQNIEVSQESNLSFTMMGSPEENAAQARRIFREENARHLRNVQQALGQRDEER